MGLRSTTAWACVAAMLLTSAPAVSAPMGFQPVQITVKNEQIIQVHRKKRYKRYKHKHLVRRHHHHHHHARHHHRHHRHHHHLHGDALLAIGIIGLGLAIAGKH